MKRIYLLVAIVLQILCADTWQSFSHTTDFIRRSGTFYNSPKGALWVTTNNGLARKIDSTWQSFTPENSSLPRGDNLYYLSFISEDSVMMRTGLGNGPLLFVVNGTSKLFSFSEMNPNEPIKRDTISPLCTAPNGDIWVSSFNHGCFRYHEGVWSNFDSTNVPTLTKNAYDGFYFNGNNIWFLGLNDVYGGVVRFDSNSWSKWDTSNSPLPENKIYSMAIDKRGYCWFQTWGGRLIGFDGDTTWVSNYTNAEGVLKTDCRNITIDSDTTAWFTNDSGLAAIRDTGIEYYNYPSKYSGWKADGKPAFDKNNTPWITLYNKLDVNNPRVILHYDWKTWAEWDSVSFTESKVDPVWADSKHEIWTRAWKYGSPNNSKILHYADTGWEVFTPYNTSLANDTITAFIVDNSNIAYIATNYGISQYRDKKWNAWPDSVVGVDNITSLYSDKSGNLWVGSSSGSSNEGLAKFDGSSWSLITTANSNLPSPEIYDICEGSGKLWISHREGISSYDGTTFTNYTRGKEFPVSVSMGGITFDKSGNLWAATSNGACKFDGTNWTTFDSSNSSMPVNYLFDVAVDTAGDLWFGSLKSGLVKFDGSSWSTIDSANGAPSNDIRKVVTDPFGKLWIPTDKGVYKFDGSSWSMYDSANSDLQDNRISSIAIGADGSKWFGTKYNGIAQLIDDDIVGTVAKPAVKTIAPKLTVVGNEIRFSGTGAASLKLFDLRGRVVFRQNWADLNGPATVVPSVGKGVYVARLNVNGLVVGMKIRM